jgi:hypothetical protein
VSDSKNYQQQLTDYLAALWADVQSKGGWSLGNLWDLIADGVEHVEHLSRMLGGIPGADKKNLVADAVDSLVDVPLVPGPIERPLFRWLVGGVIDAVVAMLNRKFGKGWLDRVVGYVTGDRPTDPPLPVIEPPAPPPGGGAGVTVEQELAARVAPGAPENA